jgi:VanZ family protein
MRLLRANLKPLKYARLWFSLAYIMLAIVALASLLPAPEMGTSDKLLHFLTYGVMSAVFSTLVCQSRSLLIVVPGLILFGVVLEFLQGLTGYRSMEVYDMLANTGGVLIGLMIRFSPVPLWFRQLELIVA